MASIFISTAEISAENHAARLLESLRLQYPQLIANAAGGDILAGAGANLTVNMTGKAVMGFWEAISHLSFYKWAEERILEKLERERHDLLLLVDAPSFHLHLAKKVHARWPELPIVYYIAPKLWAWKEWRIENLRRDITRTLCIFPFEVDFFRKRGVDAVFVGNPTLDQLRGIDNTEMVRRLGVGDIKLHSEPEKGVLAVFPGSRVSEIKYLWPVMVETVGVVRRSFPQLKVAVAVAPGITREGLDRYARCPADFQFVEGGKGQELLAASSAVLAKSGTTTLEAALLGKPMVVCYAAHRASYYIAKMFVKLPHFSLPNILAGREVVREFVQDGANAANLGGELLRILGDRRYYRGMRGRLKGIRGVLGEEYAARKAARELAPYLR